LITVRYAITNDFATDLGHFPEVIGHIGYELGGYVLEFLTGKQGLVLRVGETSLRFPVQ